MIWCVSWKLLKQDIQNTKKPKDTDISGVCVNQTVFIVLSGSQSYCCNYLYIVQQQIIISQVCYCGFCSPEVQMTAYCLLHFKTWFYLFIVSHVFMLWVWCWGGLKLNVIIQCICVHLSYLVKFVSAGQLTVYKFIPSVEQWNVYLRLFFILHM